MYYFRNFFLKSGRIKSFLPGLLHFQCLILFHPDQRRCWYSERHLRLFWLRALCCSRFHPPVGHPVPTCLGRALRTAAYVESLLSENPFSYRFPNTFTWVACPRSSSASCQPGPRPRAWRALARLAGALFPGALIMGLNSNLRACWGEGLSPRRELWAAEAFRQGTHPLPGCRWAATPNPLGVCFPCFCLVPKLLGFPASPAWLSSFPFPSIFSLLCVPRGWPV